MQVETTCVTSNGACKLTLLNKKDKCRIQDFKKVLKEENIIEEEEFVTHIESLELNEPSRKILKGSQYY